MGVFDARLQVAARARLRGEPWLAPALLVAGALGLAGLSLLAPSSPSYDPFAWLVWGRELTHAGQTFAVAGGPSWKPLPVLFTAPLSLTGDAAPALWLLVVRAGLLLALAGAWALGARLAGRWAAALAVVALALVGGVVSLALRGASEPLLLACVLWAIERHLAGRRTQAFALAVAAALVRPEAFAFVLLYAAWCWRAARPRERVLLAGGLLLVPLLWLGPPAALGDALSPSRYATAYPGGTGDHPGLTALRRGLGLTSAAVWILAAAALVLRPRDRTVRVLAAGAVAWLALVVVMTIGGYPGLARFMLPAAAVACVLAGVGAVELARRLVRWRRPLGVALAAAALAALVAAWVAPLGAVPGQVREATRLGSMQRQLPRAIAAAGGPAAVLACGTVAVNGTAQTALAWRLGVPLARVAQRLPGTGVAFVGPHSPELGAPPAATLRGARHRVVARAGVWRVVAVSAPSAPLPRGCMRAARRASGRLL
ncbi:MAG: hypothetical protein JSS99_14995 [Actinobacteria bacterium]|nr:hypothetical protein [Actinomycetota bacterium]